MAGEITYSKCERYYPECCQLAERLRGNQLLQKIYSDVPLRRMISEMEEYKRDLERAEELFGE